MTRVVSEIALAYKVRVKQGKDQIMRVLGGPRAFNPEVVEGSSPSMRSTNPILGTLWLPGDFGPIGA